MAAGEQGATRRRGRPAREGDAVTSPSGTRVMVAFRIPKPIHSELTQEAREVGSDLTGYVNRLFDGFLHSYGLPSVVREGLDADRAALGFGKYDYFQYVLFRRYEDAAKNGPAFDKKKGK